MKKFIFLQLNEINFEILKKYIKKNKIKLRNFEYIQSSFKYCETFAEQKYDLLEPWIQWVSVFTGKQFSEHKIFRLGDIVYNKNLKQIFEVLEEKGLSVGAISPMNVENRLKKPSYFIPDPWTNSNSDNSSFSKRITKMLRQTVNDNGTQKLSISSIMCIFEIIIRTLNLKRTNFLIRLIISSFFKPWKRSLVLDYLIHMVHIYFLKKKKVDFSSIFFNAGAHIQHHYFFNSKHAENSKKNPSWYIKSNADPVLDMFIVYDKILEDYLKLYNDNHKIFIATGLRQVPYDNIKYYYRLRDHKNFLNKIKIKYSKLFTRMTRDFEIQFENSKEMLDALDILKKIYVKKNNENLFKEIEVREKSLFVTLTYPKEIMKDDLIIAKNKNELSLFNEVIFLAIKNGMHETKGYAFASQNIKNNFSKKIININDLNQFILNSH